MVEGRTGWQLSGRATRALKRMSRVKKYAMLGVKATISGVPKPWRERLKRNGKLTEIYRQALHRSGLFYGVPSQRVQRAQYRRFLRWQAEQLNAFVAPSITAMAVWIKGDLHGVGNTFNALQTQSVPVNVLRHADDWRSLNDDVFVLLLNAGDSLCEHALACFYHYQQQADLVYSDTDTFDEKRRELAFPRFLPDWNPDLQLSSAYVSTGVMIRKSLLARLPDPMASIADIMAQAYLTSTDVEVAHIPFTLVHRQQDVAAEKKDCNAVAARVLQHREGMKVQVDKDESINRWYWPVMGQPLVSLVIPTRNAWQLVRGCVTSIVDKTHYPHFEILLVDNASDDPQSLTYFNQLATHPKIRLLHYPGEFNYSAINNFAVKHAKGEVIGLINNDVEVIAPDWLDVMLGHAMRQDVGCVGAKLLYPDDRIQHAGVVLGYGGGAGHAHKCFPRHHSGYLKRLSASHNYSAVTAACLLVKRSLYDAVGGLNEVDLTVAFNDVDFCLRVRELGVRNLYCAEAELYHHESVSRGFDTSPEKAARFAKEVAYLQHRWAHIIAHDPAYNPNLTLRRENFAMRDHY